ncbi:MAG: recombinase family protein [Clostridiales bacterium]|nr:recombinase family protein [Clostridiales bacterium]
MKAAIYVRVSTELEAQTSSLVAQEELFIKYIIDKGWTLFKVYKESLSATKSESRPKFNELLQDVKDGKVDVILAKELSRLARNIGVSAEFKKIVISNDVHIITLDGAIDTTKGDVSKYGLYAWIYEEESRRTSNRIKTSFRTSAENGRYMKGEAPYGYDVSDGRLYPREDESVSVVQLIYKMYLEGHGRDSIAKYLTGQKIETPAMSKGKKNAGTVWHGTTVMVILRNRHYIGDLEQCKETTKDITLIGRKKLEESVVVENTHEGIISRADYFSVQHLVNERGLKSRGRSTPTKSLFTDMLYCGDCHKKFWFIKAQRTYFCGGYKKNGKTFCTKHKIKEDELIDVLRRDLRKYVSEVSDQNQIYALIEKRVNKLKTKSKQLEKSYEMRKANHKEAKGKLILRYTGGDISKSEYDLASEVLDNQMIELEKQISKLVASENEASMRKSFDYMKSQLASYGNFDAITREVLNRFISKIVVSENETIEITYKFSV